MADKPTTTKRPNGKNGKRRDPQERWPMSLRTVKIATHDALMRGAGARHISVGDFIERLIAVHAYVQDLVERADEGDPKERLAELRAWLLALGMERIRM